jgi:hypothetical protein
MRVNTPFMTGHHCAPMSGNWYFPSFQDEALMGPATTSGGATVNTIIAIGCSADSSVQVPLSAHDPPR